MIFQMVENTDEIGYLVFLFLEKVITKNPSNYIQVAHSFKSPDLRHLNT